MKGVVLLAAAIAAVAIVASQAIRATRAEAAGATPVAGAASRAPRPGAVPLVEQAYRNNCETAALSMLLASAGVRVDQRVLQRQVAKSGPLDPIVGPDGTWTWGAPDQGFVGRVDGGGTAGGFGVYQGPIRRLAARHGVRLTDLSRVQVEAIVRRLRAGRPVLAWIGLSEGPYRRWRTPAGRPISVNFGEHTVVLTGIRGTEILVNDPLTGRRLEWSIAEFAERWGLLGRRALGL